MHILTNVSLIYGIDLGFRWVITKKGPFITHATCVNKLPSRITQTQLFFFYLFVLAPIRDWVPRHHELLTRTKPPQLHIISKIQVLLSVSKTHMFIASSRKFHHKTAGSWSSELFLIRTPPLFFSGVPLAFCVTYCLFIGGATFFYVKYFKLYKRTWPEEGKQANKTEPFVMRATEQSFRCTLAAEISWKHWCDITFKV